MCYADELEYHVHIDAEGALTNTVLYPGVSRLTHSPLGTLLS